MSYKKICEFCGKPFTTPYQKARFCSVSCATTFQQNGSICWDCDNYFCSWIAREEPVKGWVAISRPYPTEKNKNAVTYKVQRCPEFKKVKKNERK